MSDVSPSDGGYYYNAKSLNDLEDEVKADAKRAEAKRKEAEETREKKEGEALRKKDRDIQETVDSLRQDSKEAYVRDRDRERDEIGRIRAQNYDRWGRSGGESASELSQQVASLKDASEKQHRDDTARLANAEAYHEKQLERVGQENEETRTRAIQEARDSAGAAYAEHLRDEKRAFRDNQNDARGLYEKNDRERAQELGETESRLESQLQKQQEGFRYSTDRVRRAAEDQVRAAEERANERSQGDARRLQASHDEQTADLRDQLSRLVNADKDYAKEKGQARADAIKEHADEFRTYQHLQDDRNTLERDDLKRQLTENSRNLNRRNAEMVAAKDTFYTKTMARQAGDAHADAVDARNAFQRDHDQLEGQLHQEHERADQTTERLLGDSEQRHSNALAAQALAGNEALKRQKQSDGEQNRRLEQQLEQKTAARSTADISPAAEERSRQSFLREYTKTSDAERARNDDLVASLQRNQRERYNELLEAKATNETTLNRRAAGDRDEARAALMDGLQEAQVDKESALRNSDHTHQSEVDSLSRNHASTLEHQRRDYETMIQQLRDDAVAKQSALRQESDFNSRMATRAFSARQNELIREYEKKLTDQKSDYDGQIDDLKTNTQQSLHEKDRAGRQAIEEQGRSYEQRLAQLEAQHKERERLISQNYSDELEKVKRSNALLIQKKG